MVEDANIKRIHSEKLYADANHQVCLLDSITWYKICLGNTVQVLQLLGTRQPSGRVSNTGSGGIDQDINFPQYLLIHNKQCFYPDIASHKEVCMRKPTNWVPDHV